MEWSNVNEKWQNNRKTLIDSQFINEWLITVHICIDSKIYKQK